MGVKSLADKYPALVEEAWLWDPKKYSAGSGVIKEWKGKCGHFWNAEINVVEPGLLNSLGHLLIKAKVSKL